MRQILHTNWRRDVAIWCALALLLWLDQALPHATVPIRGAFIGALIAGIAQAFGWLASQAVTIAITVAQAAIMIGSALAQFAVLVGGVFVKVWGFLGQFWSTALKPFIQWSWSQVVRLHDALQRVFAPVLRFLEATRKEFLKIYDKWFKPIFDTIEITRRILQVLATLHLDWARELDRKLAELEDRLLQPIVFVMRKLNEAMNVVNRVVTLDGLFQRLALVESLWHYTGDLWAVLIKHQPAGVSAAQNAELSARSVEAIDPAALSRSVSEYFTTGGGELAPAIDEIVTQRTLRLESGQ